MRRPVFLTKNEIERSRLGGRMSNGAESVLRERERHLSHEGWTAKHDDGHRAGEIARAAACYALSAGPEKVSEGIMAAYWKAVSVYAKHLARVIDPISARHVCVVAPAERTE